MSQILQAFFQLGLPDTRGAKWVTAYGEGMPMEGLLRDSQNGTIAGNAWLVREESGGIVDLVVGQNQRLRGRRNDGSQAPEAGKKEFLPQVQVQAADLDKDMAILAAAAEKKMTGSESGSNSIPEYEQRQKTQGAGRALLFLAHLERQDRGDYVSKVLPGVLAQASSADKALDAAVSLVADGRLAQLSNEWETRGDAAAYARGLEALAGEFSRGWDHRDAALLLARRIRNPTPAPEASDANAKKAAGLLLALKPEGLSELPMEHNWMLPGPIPGSEFNPVSPSSPLTEDQVSTTAESGTAPRSALTVFLSGKRTAAAALARLLNDHRLVHIPRNSESR